MTSFKRWSGTGAIVLVALALIACPSAVEIPATVAKEIGDMSFDHDATAASKITLTAYFNVTEPVYTAKSSNTKVATASVTGAELTVTPVGPGSANVTVTAKGEEGSVAQTFGVTVASPPVTPDPEPTPRPAIIGTIPTPVTYANADSAPYPAQPLALFFSGATSYNSSSIPEGIASVSIEGDILSIAPLSAGSTVVVIRAINAGGSVAQSVVVNVGPPPVTPVAPLRPVTILKDFASQNFAHDDMADRTFMLSEHFSGATIYDVSSDETIAMAAEAAGVLTVTPVAPGDTVISVTGSNDDARTPDITLTFNVTVEEAPKPPVLKMGMSFMDLKLVGNDTDTAAADVANATMTYDLDTYFTDPDGFSLIYSTKTSDVKTVSVYDTPAMETDAHPEVADTHTMSTADNVTIRGRTAGTATITVVATDASGMSTMRTFMVTVYDTNSSPAIQGSDPADLTAADRLKVGAPAEKVTIDFGAHFTDTDVADRAKDDTWKLTAETSDATILTVTYSLTDKPDMPDEVEVMITAVGPGMAMVILKATDSFGESAMKDFDVQVNNRPDAQSAADYMGFMEMAVGDAVPIDLDGDDGYFSDEDAGDSLTCEFRTNQHNVAEDMRTATVELDTQNQLTVTAKKIGTMTMEVWCSDSFEDSDRVTFSVDVDRGA